MVIMAVDLGRARTGLAICDKGEMLSSPLTQINEYNRERLIEKIAQIAKEKSAELIVVGMPKNMDGSEGESAKNARLFAKELCDAAGIQTDLQDERGTTITAHQYLNATNTRGKKRKSVVDTLSATIILEDYLNRRKNGYNAGKE
ncbi:MAG: Holliday junction resolvase RuvX [Oscillospiraceae bacterium]|nr:Holliday junction resolvase RuvX [Oscillospiraceae bacterium]